MVTPSTRQKTILDDLPCRLPTRRIPTDIDPASICNLFHAKLADLDEADFTSDAIWRDICSLTSTLRTFYSAAAILPTWRSLCQVRKAAHFKLQPDTAFVRLEGPQVSWIEVSFTFNMAMPVATSCLGYLCLVLDGDDTWKIWLVGTILDQIPVFGNVDRLDPVDSLSACADGHPRDEHLSTVYGSSAQPDPYSIKQSFDCVIVGAGQAGLSTAGRLQALGVSYLCVESNNEIGDSWRLRYDSLKLHTTRESSHLPFEQTFTADHPKWLSTKDLAHAFKAWSERYGVTYHIWLSTTLVSGSWNESAAKWTLNLQRRFPASGKVEMVTITTSHVVLAIGINSQILMYLDYAEKSKFQGIVMHSKDYKNSSQWKGKHGVVVGSGNTGHDIAEDMIEAGLASVTIVQRSKTYVISQTDYENWAKTQYNNETDILISDLKAFAFPNAVSRKLGLLNSRLLCESQPNLYSDLEKAGFLLDLDDELLRHVSERFGGHYMDTGVSKKIADGLIKMKTDSLPISYTKTGLEFANGSHLEADVVVFATGFLGNMRDVVRQIFGDKVADRAGDCWGVDSEGEIKGAYKPTGQPGLWYIGGGLNNSRFFSRFVALQIKASIEGKTFPLFDAKRSNISCKL